jgi:hypothetical protein
VNFETKCDFFTGHVCKHVIAVQLQNAFLHGGLTNEIRTAMMSLYFFIRFLLNKEIFFVTDDQALLRISIALLGQFCQLELIEECLEGRLLSNLCRHLRCSCMQELHCF